MTQLDALTSDSTSENTLNTSNVGPVAISEAPNHLIDKLRVSTAGHLWPPFLADGHWVILRLDDRANAPLDESTQEQLLDELFEQWLNQRISELLTGQHPKPIPHHLVDSEIMTSDDSIAVLEPEQHRKH